MIINFFYFLAVCNTGLERNIIYIYRRYIYDNYIINDNRKREKYKNKNKNMKI